MAYGVDATGRPVAEGQPSTGQQTGCPEGQKSEGGKCVPSNRVMGENGAYSEGTKTYDSHGLLQGDTGYNRAALADRLYQYQMSQDNIDNKGKNFNLDTWLGQNQDVATGVKSGKGGEMLLTPEGGAYDVRRGYNPATNEGAVVSFGAAGGNEGDVAGSAWSSAALGGGGGVGDYLAGHGGGFTGGSFVPSTPAPGAYTINPYTGSKGLPTYTAAQFTKPADFQSSLQAPTQDMIQRLLSSDGSMNPAVVAQMKEGQKFNALSMADQLKQQASTNAASRGVSMGGNLQAQLGGIDANAVGNISKGYRDTDVAAATTNRADQLNAIGASSQFQNQLMQQYLGQNAQNLGVDQANAAEQKTQFASEQAKAADEYQRYLSGEQLGLAGQDQAFQQWAASQGLSLTSQNYAMLADQFNKTYGLNVGRFLAGN